MNSFPISLTFLLLVTGPCAAMARDSISTETSLEVTPALLDRLITEAQGTNPALVAAGVRTKASNAAVSSVRTWEDPTATFGISEPSSKGFRSSEEGNLIYGIDQKLPLYGRPDLVRKVAEAHAIGSMYTADLEIQRTRRDIETALRRLALADKEADVAEEDLSWLDATLDAVDHRYRVGQASQVDWLKVQTARALAVDEVRTKDQERSHGSFALNRLLNRPLHSHWPRVAITPVQPPLYYTERLVEAALASEPELKVLGQESASAQAEADLTRRQRLPDVSVGLQARQYSGDGGVREGSALISMSLPWLNKGKYDDDWRRDRLKKQASDLAVTDHALSVREQLHHHVVDLDAARRQAELYRDQLIPLTRQTLESAQASWEHNLGGFQDVLDAHRMLLANELVLSRALTDQAILLAELSFLTGSRDPQALLELAGTPPQDHDDLNSEDSK